MPLKRLKTFTSKNGLNIEEQFNKFAKTHEIYVVHFVYVSGDIRSWTNCYVEYALNQEEIEAMN